MSNFQPRILVDIDGVIHQYSKGWHNGTAYDVPMPGARAALVDMELKGYEVIIFSTRDKTQIKEWLAANDFKAYQVTNEKLPCQAFIDDRAIRFIDWSSALTELHERYPIKQETL